MNILIIDMRKGSEVRDEHKEVFDNADVIAYIQADDTMMIVRHPSSGDFSPEFAFIQGVHRDVISGEKSKAVEDKRIKWFDFKKLDKSCAAPMLDLHADAAGDVTAKFAAYTEAANRKLVDKSVAPIKAELPPGAVEMLVKYPSMLECAR